MGKIEISISYSFKTATMITFWHIFWMGSGNVWKPHHAQPFVMFFKGRLIRFSVLGYHAEQKNDSINIVLSLSSWKMFGKKLWNPDHIFSFIYNADIQTFVCTFVLKNLTFTTFSTSSNFFQWNELCSKVHLLVALNLHS